MKTKSYNLKKHFIFSLLLTVLAVIIFNIPIINTYNLDAQGAIGVIGGADGPTAIFLSYSETNIHIDPKIFLFFYLYFKFIVFFVVTLLLYKPFKMLIEK